MKIPDKLAMAKNAIRFVTRHDDAPIEHIEAAAVELKAHIDSEVEGAKVRRAAAEEAARAAAESAKADTAPIEG